jgi:hypothetical protein
MSEELPLKQKKVKIFKKWIILIVFITFIFGFFIGAASKRPISESVASQKFLEQFDRIKVYSLLEGRLLSKYKVWFTGPSFNRDGKHQWDEVVFGYEALDDMDEDYLDVIVKINYDILSETWSAHVASTSYGGFNVYLDNKLKAVFQEAPMDVPPAVSKITFSMP